MRTETEDPTEARASTGPLAVVGAVPVRPADEEPHSRRARLKRRMLVVAAWPYHSLRIWIDRRRNVIDLRDRGLNAAVGLTETATRPGEPAAPAASDAARGTGTTG